MTEVKLSNVRNWLWTLSQRIFPPITKFDKGTDAQYKQLRENKEFRDAFPDFDSIYFIGAFEYSYDNYLKLESAIQQNEIKEFLEAVKYNMMGNNVELYFIENKRTMINDILITLDPFELFASNTILKIIHSTTLDISTLNPKMIFSIDD